MVRDPGTKKPRSPKKESLAMAFAHEVFGPILKGPGDYT